MTAGPLTEADRRSLEFAAAHRLVDARQVGTLLGENTAHAEERLDGLASGGLLGVERWGAVAPGHFWITASGLRAIGSRLPPAGFDRRPAHTLAVGWLWLTASTGGLGAVDRVLSARQMQAEDRERSPAAPFDVRPGEFGGRRRVHYADLMLLRQAAGRVAIELVLSAPPPDELAAVLRGYGADARMAGVLLLVNDPWIGRFVQALAAGLELTAFARVQRALLG